MSQSVNLEEDCKGVGCHLGQGLCIIAISIEIKEKPYSISYLTLPIIRVLSFWSMNQIQNASSSLGEIL